MDLLRILAGIYCLMFFGVVALDFIPPFTDDAGRLFGLFTLDFYDNSLHAASGIWAGIAAWHSRSWSVFFFKLFGLLYFFDGVLGFFTGSGYLDFGIFLYGPLDLPLMTRFLANLPHLLIGGFAIYAGFRMSKREILVGA